MKNSAELKLTLKGRWSAHAMQCALLQVSLVPPVARQPGWVQSVAACKNHGLALLVNGTVVQWGNNTMAGFVPDAALSNVLSISCNDDTSFAYKVRGD
jgi:hypothetical protein